MINRVKLCELSPMEHRVKLVGVRYSLAIAALRVHLNNNRTMFILTLAADRIRANKNKSYYSIFSGNKITLILRSVAI